jgi:hypothetical protein
VPLLESQRFLAEDIRLQQVALLLDLLEAKQADSTFDLNKYPDLWDDYEKMPGAIREIFEPYVTRSIPEQKSIGS